MILCIHLAATKLPVSENHDCSIDALLGSFLLFKLELGKIFENQQLKAGKRCSDRRLRLAPVAMPLSATPTVWRLVHWHTGCPATGSGTRSQDPGPGRAIGRTGFRVRSTGSIGPRKSGWSSSLPLRCPISLDQTRH